MEIPIIDLFAGPGGLGEGFTRYDKGDIRYKIALSIEMDKYAHKTLELRAFYRQFDKNKVPYEYYDYLAGIITREELFNSYPEEARLARDEAWLHELNDGDIDKVRHKTRKALENHGSDHWVLIGGPPCQAYSVVGRARMKNHKEGFDKDERNYLYQHYLRIVAHLEPSIFIMENVKGFLTANVKGERIFDKVLDDLEFPGQAVKELDNKQRSPTLYEYDIYSLVAKQEHIECNSGTKIKKLKPQDYIIHCEKYGVPQKRHRVILMGIRKDLDPAIWELLVEKDPVPVRKVLNDLPKIRSGITQVEDKQENWKGAIQELVTGDIFREIDTKTRKEMKKRFETIGDTLSRGFIHMNSSGTIKDSELAKWYDDKRLNCVCNHQSKAHMKEDLWRYYFSTCYAKAHNKSPLLTDYPAGLLPDHNNITPENTKFLDRFKVQVGHSPASTVTSHISKDGHFFIHHDPKQCRAWTVREAARIQTFPDNYFFEGNRTEQYQQVGNAVPPLLAYQIAHVVAKQLKEM